MQSEEEKLKSYSSIMLQIITFTFFPAFIGVVFLRHHKVTKVFYALNLKVFPK